MLSYKLNDRCSGAFCFLAVQLLFSFLVELFDVFDGHLARLLLLVFHVHPQTLLQNRIK